MSSFTSEGHKPFMNTHSDSQRLGECSEWPDVILETKVTEYWQFLMRDDLQPRATAAAHRILEHLGFEIDYRAGVYNPEVTDGA